MSNRLVLLVAAALGLGAPSLMADPPARVGRLNLIQGAVSFRPASVEEWAIAQPNRPLTTGDRLWTDDNARAEVHIGSTAIRLSAQTEFDFVNVDDQTMQARLAQGTATIRIRSLDEGQVYEIDTPNSAITFGRAGEYRIDVSGDGTQSVVAVWQGAAEVSAAGSSFEVNSHQRATVNGTDAPTYDLADLGGPDTWDQWSQSRDHREDASVSVRYVSREMPGYEDLDEYGHWTSVEDYGNVWVPDHVGPGWAPYHTGHWVWVDPWGWTWVDDAPWGYAPYHYGRWAYVRQQWVWCPHPVPGPDVVVYSRPVYAPALVAFVGGRGWSVGVTVGGGESVGWVPLAPYEVYHPPYAVSQTYVHQVNVVNNTTIINQNTTVINNYNNTTVVNKTTNITNGAVPYRNARAPGAVTAVSSNTMSSGQPVARSAVPVSVTQLEKAPPPVLGSAPTGVVPQRSSVLGVGGPAAKAPPAGVQNRQVVARTAPPPAAVPFEQQQKALASNGGRPLGVEQQNQIRQSLPAQGRPAAVLVRPMAMTDNNGGGFKPARAGLPAVQSVKAAPSGPVAPPAKVAGAPAPAAAAPGAVAPAPRVAQPPTRVAEPNSTGVKPAAPATATRVPRPGQPGQPAAHETVTPPPAVRVPQPGQPGQPGQPRQPRQPGEPAVHAPVAAPPTATHVPQPGQPGEAAVHAPVAPPPATHVPQPGPPQVSQPQVSQPQVSQPQANQPAVRVPPQPKRVQQPPDHVAAPNPTVHESSSAPHAAEHTPPPPRVDRAPAPRPAPKPDKEKEKDKQPEHGHAR